MLVQIKPTLQHQSTCPYCKVALQAQPQHLLWQGMQVFVELTCGNCQRTIVDSLATGHMVTRRIQLNRDENRVFDSGSEQEKRWDLGQQILRSLQNPQHEELRITKEIFRSHRRVILLNCIDYLYGHSLLKLLNAQTHLASQSNEGLIVIVPQFLRWLVPLGIAEVWTVDLPLRRGCEFYPALQRFIDQELQRFDQVYLSPAHSHPSQFDIAQLTGTSKHDFAQDPPIVTFIWREDRIWSQGWIKKVLSRVKLFQPLLWLQNLRVCHLFQAIQKQVPKAQFVVAGLGRSTQFPAWITDARVGRFDCDTEKNLCQIYAKSRLVIGVHGSNLLLPSGHAGMTLDLMPTDRWGNFAQDILYQEPDPRFAAFRYRYLPIATPLRELAIVASEMLLGYQLFHTTMVTNPAMPKSPLLLNSGMNP